MTRETALIAVQLPLELLASSGVTQPSTVSSKQIATPNPVQSVVSAQEVTTLLLWPSWDTMSTRLELTPQLHVAWEATVPGPPHLLQAPPAQQEGTVKQPPLMGTSMPAPWELTTQALVPRLRQIATIAMPVNTALIKARSHQLSTSTRAITEGTT